MRLFCFFLMLLFLSPAFAASSGITVAKPETPPSPGIEVVEQNNKPPAKEVPVKKDDNSDVSPSSNPKDDRADVKWIDIDGTTRRTIVTSWLELDEATRPPFPSYFAQWMKNGAQPAAPEKPPSNNEAAEQTNKGETTSPAR